MRRILHFMADVKIGSGMATVVMNYYRHIDRSRVQFDFLCFEDGSLTYAQEIESLGGRVFYIPRPRLLSMEDIRDFFHEHQGEFWVLHCHPIWSAAVLGPIAKRYGARAVFLHSHSEKPGESKVSILRNRLMLYSSAKKVDVCLACSNVAAKVLNRYTSTVYILPNAIDTHAFLFDSAVRQSSRRQLGIAPQTHVIGHVGRMVDVKNQDFLLRAFALYCMVEPAAQLLLIGSGPLDEKLHTLASELGIENNVRFMGACRNIAQLYAAMDVFVMPSLYEGLSMALLEAQAAGLPCVISDTISAEADITGHIYRLPIDQPQIWADTLIKVLNMPKKRTYGIEEAFNRKKLDIYTVVQELITLYERI